jgi:hypothetical protein
MSQPKSTIDVKLEPETVCQRFDRFLRTAESGKYRIKGNFANCRPKLNGCTVIVNEKYGGPFRDDDIENTVTISCGFGETGYYVRKYVQFPYNDQ